MNIRKLVFDTYRIVGADRLFMNRSSRVLFYHGVAQKIADARIETESISADDFERQLKYIVRHFRPITLDEFYLRFVSKEWEGREILLTFDDGYKNMLYTGLPLLEKYNIPFALFLTADNITSDQLFPTTINRIVNLASSYSKSLENPRQISEATSRRIKTENERVVKEICNDLLARISDEELNSLRLKYSSINPMNWDEAKEIAKSPLCSIGSHCMSHICCHSNQDPDEVKRQFVESREIISRKTGVDCDFLSYPNGSHTPGVTELARETGYKMAFTTRYEPIDSNDGNIMAVGRIYVPYDYSRFVYGISRFPR